MFTELKSVLRSLGRAPGYTIMVVLMLALGLGSAGALYRMMMDTLFYYRAYQDSDTLIRVTLKSPDSAFSSQVFMPRFLAYRESAGTLAEIAGSTGLAVNLIVDGEPVGIYAGKVTANYFSMMGIEPMLGRGFLPEEGQTDHDKVTVLTHWFWQSRFGGDPSVLGRDLLIDGVSYRVVGILRKDFNPPLSLSGGQLYVPYVVPVEVKDREAFMGLGMVARLKPGVTLQQAEAELRTLQPEREKPYAKAMEKYVAVTEPLDGPAAFDAVRRYQLMQRTGLAAVALLYGIACVNAGGLMLVRMLKRSRELAIRFSLGGTRAMVFRLMLWEGLLLSLAAVVVGVIFANWLMPVLFSFVQDTTTAGAWKKFTVEPGAIGLLAGLGAISGVVIATAITWTLARADLSHVMKEGGAGSGESRRTVWLRSSLVVVEVALAVTLLAGAGLMVRTFQQLQNAKLGYQVEQRFSGRLDMTKLRMSSWDVRRERLNQVMERVRALPGVSGVGLSNGLGVSYYSPMKLQVAGRAGGADEEIRAQGMPVSADYLEVLGVPLKSGRTFGGMRKGDAPVVVINEAMARTYFAGRNPRGEQLIISPKHKWEIVGVVGDIRSMRNEAQPQFYYPEWQYQYGSWGSQLLIRTAGAPGAGFLKEVHKAIYEADPTIVLSDMSSLVRQQETEVNQERQALALLKVLSGLALLLALVGLGAMMTYTVAQRRAEFGIRMALGATEESILGLVIKRGVFLVALGVAAGLALSWGLARFLETLLYQTKPHDPVIYGLVGLSMLLVAIPACWWPARQATKVNLTKLLRSE